MLSSKIPSQTGYARWCFKTDKNRFKSMGEAVNRCIEGIWSQSPRPSSFTITSAGQTYFIDFDTMKQRNMDTKFVRDIERQFVDLATGQVTTQAPLCLLLPSGNVLTAANSQQQQVNNAAAASANSTSSATSNAAATSTNNVGAPLRSYNDPRKRIRPSPNPKDPNCKTYLMFKKREQHRSEMRDEAKESYDKIISSIKHLPVDLQHRALARAVAKLLTPSSLANSRAAEQECKNLKDKYNKRKQFRMSKACRHQLALNLGRYMIGTGAPQW